MLQLNHASSQCNKLKPHIPLPIKFSIIRDIANGLMYLHKHSPPIIHGNLSAQNVLLNSALLAKIADLRVSHIIAHLTPPMTRKSTAFVYMAPEIHTLPLSMKASSDVDIFSFGVISIFTLSPMFPCDLSDVSYKDKNSGTPTELERRNKYMQSIYSLLNQGHPLVHMIQQCIHNVPKERSDISRVIQLIEQVWAEASTCEGYRECNLTRLELIQALLPQKTSKTHVSVT